MERLIELRLKKEGLVENAALRSRSRLGFGQSASVLV